MSRMLSTRRSRKPRNSPGVRALSFDEETVDDPQPSTSRGYPRLRNAIDPLLYLYSSADEVDDEGSDEDYTPPLKFSRTSNLSELGCRFRLCPAGGYLLGLGRAPRGIRQTKVGAQRSWNPFFCLGKGGELRQASLLRGDTGVHAHLDESSDPMEIFSSLFPEELFQTIVDETNQYARQNPRTPSSHMKGWEDTTVREVRSYVGLRFLMGLHGKRCQRDLWSTDPLMCSSVFAKTMSRDCFDILTSALHFANNEGEHSAEDRLWKLRPVIDVLDSTYRSVFVPRKNVTVDESLWAFKGRHQALQYNPSKRARRGLKVYKLCSSDGPEAGYTAAFNIYMGQDCGEFPASMKAVDDLMEKAKLLGKGYQLYTDNWYSLPDSLPLSAGPEDHRRWHSTCQQEGYALGPAGESGTHRLPE
ncbi:piggyBac transposable element-derived protein 4-like [Penaeus chinensis]|uniref:piggyBac transposable element-derived protein 4-like n=1 Tax=Penaeus chinensis TaxID=139456 RepID=UPI001FB60A79|nr:piggyBac transposable element-derived protein 4-like [Penaeus chinensis]